MLQKPILHDTDITLRPMCVDDAAVVIASFADQEVMRLTGTQKTPSLEEVETFYSNAAVAEDRVDYAIISNANPKQVLGEVVFNEIDWANRCAGFRIALFAETYFGRGFGTKATARMLRFGFEELDLHRIELEVYEFNPRAIHVYEACGFTREGVRRDVLCRDGKYYDSIVMSLLTPEYKR